MFIGAATIQLEITDALTLKDKRQVVKSLLARLQDKFNVAVAEVDRLDSARFATLAVVTVANDGAFVHRVLEKVADFVEQDPRAVVLDYATEIL
jgi:uncharacterized protein YlxP (DUF503 family)